MSVVIVANLNLPSIGAGSVYIEDQYNLGNRTGPSDPTAPVNTVPPAVTGDPYPGSTLTGTLGTWTGTSTIRKARQWYRKPDGGEYALIVGAKAATYVIPADEADLSTFKLVVTADNAAAGVVSADSNEVLSYTALGVVVTAIPDDDADGVYALAATVTGGLGDKTYLWELTLGTGVITDETTLDAAVLTVTSTNSYTAKLTVTDDSGSANDTEDFAFTVPLPSGAWTNGAADGLYTTAGNWGGAAVPTSATDVLFGDVDDDCSLDSAKDVRSINFTGFTGIVYADSGVVYFNLNGGDVTCAPNIISAAHNNNDRILFYFNASGVFTANGFDKAYPAIDTGTLTLGDSCTLFAFDAGADIQWGTRQITFAIGNGLDCYSPGTITYSAGAKVIFNAPAGTGAHCHAGTIAPPTELGASMGTLTLNHYKCESWTQAAGDVVQSGGKILTVTGDFVATGGSLTGTTVNVTGSATASNTVITNADFSGGSTLMADPSCTDGGGNTNVTFAPPITFNNIFVGSGSPHLSYSNGDLDVSVTVGAGSNICAISTNVPTTGKWYGEIRAISGTVSPSDIGLVRSDLITLLANTNVPGGTGMDNSLGYYHPGGAFGDVFTNVAGVTTTVPAAAGRNTFVADDRVGIFRDLDTGKMMFYDIPAATGIATAIDVTDYDISGWSAGQGFAMAAAIFSASGVLRLCVAAGDISTAGAAIALARGATVG